MLGWVRFEVIRHTREGRSAEFFRFEPDARSAYEKAAKTLPAGAVLELKRAETVDMVFGGEPPHD